MEVQMWRTSRANRHGVLILTLFEIIGLTAVAMAEPIAPAKVRTLTIHPPSAEDDGGQLASPENSLKFHTSKVRPQLPEASRDGSGRRLTGEQHPANAASDAVPRRVPTITVRPEPGAASDAEQHFVPSIRGPSQSPAE
jgi:hypothetical protein